MTIKLPDENNPNLDEVSLPRRQCNPQIRLLPQDINLMLVWIRPVLTLLTQAEIEMPKNPSKNRPNLRHRKTLRYVSFFEINSSLERFIYLTNTISWSDGEWLKHCTLVGSKAGVCAL